jgi:hypothetical protein
MRASAGRRSEAVWVSNSGVLHPMGESPGRRMPAESARKEPATRPDCPDCVPSTRATPCWWDDSLSPKKGRPGGRPRTRGSALLCTRRRLSKRDRRSHETWRSPHKLIPTLLRAKVNQMPLHRSTNAGSRRNISSANRIFLQFHGSSRPGWVLHRDLAAALE